VVLAIHFNLIESLPKTWTSVVFQSIHVPLSLTPHPTLLIQANEEIDIPSRHLGSNLAQTLAHPQDAIDQQAIGRALDLEVAEEGVCAEQTQDLVQGVVALSVGLGAEVCG
jgi:hypothetical protein